MMTLSIFLPALLAALTGGGMASTDITAGKQPIPSCQSTLHHTITSLLTLFPHSSLVLRLPMRLFHHIHVPYAHHLLIQNRLCRAVCRPGKLLNHLLQPHQTDGKPVLNSKPLPIGRIVLTSPVFSPFFIACRLPATSRRTVPLLSRSSPVAWISAPLYQPSIPSTSNNPL